MADRLRWSSNFVSLTIDMQEGHTESFSFPSIDGQKLFQVEIGVFIDLGSNYELLDADVFVRGFPLHIL